MSTKIDKIIEIFLYTINGDNMCFDKYAIGITIKKIRIEKQLSQEVLSGLAGIARSHLAMIETGAKQANFETICRIAIALEMKPHVLVKKIEENFPEA